MADVVLRDLVKMYESTLAVKSINFECKDGEFVAFLGPSGCGKSSTLRMIAGLEEITDGEIFIDGKRVNDIHTSKRDVAMAFENYALYPSMTVYDNMAFPLRAKCRAKDYSVGDIDRIIKEMAEVLGLDDVLDSYPSQLSGGQMQRVSLGRALVRKAKVYLLDEPISHLDARQQADIRRHLKRIHKVYNSTIMYVTHDQQEAMTMADRIAVMNNGELQQVGTPKEVFDKPANIFVADFIGEPAVNFLSGTLNVNQEIPVFHCQVFDYPLPARLRPAVRTLATGHELVLGIRPMYVRVSNVKHDDCPIGGTIYIYENLGEEALLTIKICDELIRVIVTPERVLQTEGAVWVGFSEQNLHLFDKRTGQSL